MNVEDVLDAAGGAEEAIPLVIFNEEKKGKFG